MSEDYQKALLPAGLADLLAPEARAEAIAIARLVARCEAYGYERVKPPLLEFEESLLAGAGSAVAADTFRLMDPVSQRMLGLRADMTPQIARIAACRLAQLARPLRLCYAGQVLRQRGRQLRPERQFGQIGAELIGSDSAAADCEIALLAADALTDLGITDLSLDLCLPALVGTISDSLDLPANQARALGEALDRKDAAAVTKLAGDKAEPFVNLLAAVGPLEASLPKLEQGNWPAAARQQIERLGEVARRLAKEAPDVTLTVDPVEHQGLVYQVGLSFTLFGKGVRGELGRGGRYQADCGGGESESATGFTLFTDTILRAIEPAPALQRIYLPFGSDRDKAERLRREGWATVNGLAPNEDPAQEARRLRCSHIWRAERAEALADQQETTA